MNLTYALYASIVVIVGGIIFISWEKRWIQAAWKFFFPDRLPGIPCKVLARMGIQCRLLPARIETPLHAVVETAGTQKIQNAAKVSFEWIDGSKHSFMADLDNPLGQDADGLSIYPQNVGSVYAANVSKDFIDSQWFNEALELNVAKDYFKHLEDLRNSKSVPWMKYALWAGIAILAIFLWKSGILEQVYNDIVPQQPPAQTVPAQPQQPGPSIIIPRSGN